MFENAFVYCSVAAESAKPLASSSSSLSLRAILESIYYAINLLKFTIEEK